MTMSGFSVQFVIEDKELAKVLKKLAIDLEEMLPSQSHRGGATLAKAIVEAALRSGQVEALLGLSSEPPPPSDNEASNPKPARRR